MAKDLFNTAEFLYAQGGIAPVAPPASTPRRVDAGPARESASQ